MIIETTIGDTTIRVGEPSNNHISFTNKKNVGDKPVVVNIAEWGVIKNTVDKMFKAADQISGVA